MIDVYPIVVGGRKFDCVDCYGVEYPEDYVPPRLPFQPYRYERVIDDKLAWLIDGFGIIWILEEWTQDGQTLHAFNRPCLKWCVNYICRNDPAFGSNLVQMLKEEFMVEIGEYREADYTEMVKMIKSKEK